MRDSAGRCELKFVSGLNCSVLCMHLLQWLHTQYFTAVLLQWFVILSVGVFTLPWCAADVAAAQLRLGVMYENGIGMRVNYKVSQKLLFVAALPPCIHLCHCSDKT